MERLTERDEYGNADIIALSNMMPELYAGLSYSETNALTDALNRLAAYEETGLEPEDIADLETQHRTEMCENGYDCVELGRYRVLGDYDHLRELVQAEQDGLLVVLPCKLGDTVYVIGESCDFCETYLDESERCMRCEKGHYFEERDFELWMLPELNESIFLTREEAEAALEAQKGGDEK